MIKPLNGHILIEPLEQSGYVQSDKTTYDEVGIVVSFPEHITDAYEEERPVVGYKVYFDSWQAAKFPKGNNEFYWLVPFSSIKAYEIPE